VDWSPVWLFVSRRGSRGQQQFSEGIPTTQEDLDNPKRLIQRIETGDTSEALAGLEQLTQQFRAKGDLRMWQMHRGLWVIASLAAYRYQQSSFGSRDDPVETLAERRATAFSWLRNRGFLGLEPGCL